MRYHHRHPLPIITALLWLWLGLWMGVARADSHFLIEGAYTELDDGVYRLHGRLLFRLTPEVEEALRNGVPITLLLEIDVDRKRRWAWNDTIATLRQSWRLSYHPLSGRYLVDNLNTRVRESFGALPAALRALQKLEGLPVIDAKLLDPDERYYIRVRTRLAIEALPPPMRLWTYLSSNWRLESPWYTWVLQ